MPVAKQLFHKYLPYAGLIAVGLEWLAVGLFYTFYPNSFRGDHPISYYATLPATRAIFTIFFTLAALSFLVYIHGHLARQLETPVKLFTLSMISFIAVAMVPYNPNESTSVIIHKLLAYIFALTFILGIGLTAWRAENRKLQMFSLAVVVIGIVLCLVMALFQDSPYFLFFELTVGLLGQAWIIGVSLLTINQPQIK